MKTKELLKMGNRHVDNIVCLFNKFPFTGITFAK